MRRTLFGFNPSFHIKYTIKSLKNVRFCISLKGHVKSKDVCGSVSSFCQLQMLSKRLREIGHLKRGLTSLLSAGFKLIVTLGLPKPE